MAVTRIRQADGSTAFSFQTFDRFQRHTIELPPAIGRLFNACVSRRKLEPIEEELCCAPLSPSTASAIA